VEELTEWNDLRKRVCEYNVNLLTIMLVLSEHFPSQNRNILDKSKLKNNENDEKYIQSASSR